MQVSLEFAGEDGHAVHELPQELSAVLLSHAPPQLWYPLLHVNVHAPPEHVAVAFVTVVVHAVAELHCPLDRQDSTPVPEHVVWPGAHMPVHAPVTHVWLVHATGALHWPVELQVSTPLPEHVVCPEVQTPEHVPDWHHAGDVHVVPHAPQFELSVCSLTQAPPHNV